MYRRMHNRSSDQWVNAVIDADWTDPSNPVTTGPDISQPDKIAEGFTPFYKSLYGRKTPDKKALDDCMRALNHPRHNKVLPPTADLCGSPISPEEILEQCDHLPNGKSPGPDRVPNALYKTFGNKLAAPLAHAFNEAQRNGNLPPEMRAGLINISPL
jgi:hypothetical protein